MNAHTIFISITALTGIIAAKEIIKGQYYRLRGSTYNRPEFYSFCLKAFPILLFVLAIRSIIIEPFHIPSGSMEPRLLKGDFIIVNKLNYSLKIPFTNFTLYQFNLPQRGEVVTFKNPEDHSFMFIKRVIGQPGDRIQSVNKSLYVNDRPIGEQGGGLYLPDLSRGIYTREEQIGEFSYTIQTDENRRTYDFEITVPADHYFVMGDNRDHSTDSRNWGPVHQSLITGKAEWVVYSSTTESGFRWNRMFTRIY